MQGKPAPIKGGAVESQTTNNDDDLQADVDVVNHLEDHDDEEDVQLEGKPKIKGGAVEAQSEDEDDENAQLYDEEDLELEGEEAYTPENDEEVELDDDEYFQADDENVLIDEEAASGEQE